MKTQYDPDRFPYSETTKLELEMEKQLDALKKFAKFAGELPVEGVSNKKHSTEKPKQDEQSALQLKKSYMKWKEKRYKHLLEITPTPKHTEVALVFMEAIDRQLTFEKYLEQL